MTNQLIKAFDEVRQGFSADRVIADPAMNLGFIDACQRRGLTDEPVDLNLKLLNRRKRGGLPPSSHRTVVRNQDSFAFASEIAVRSLERKHQTTLDRVLCGPELAREFDRVAEAIAPGFTPLKYRWAALRLRKTSRLKPEILGRVVPATVFGPAPVAKIHVSQIPNEQGIYILSSHDKVLYVGESTSLRARIKKHLDHSDNKFLAQYIWEFGKASLMLEYHVLPVGTRTDVRKAMELELIRSRRAEFNKQR